MVITSSLHSFDQAPREAYLTKFVLAGMQALAINE